MKTFIGALTLIALTNAAQAQSSLPNASVEEFRDQVARAGHDAVMGAMLLDLLPDIAIDCHLHLNADKLKSGVVRLDSSPLVDKFLSHIKEGTFLSPLRFSWETAATKDNAEACKAAQSLWGTSGKAFDGVLY